ncbi:HD domain-containing protein [Clostridium sp. MB40-C1]|uniref:HD domain-containing protein n=1 Tax=Clostridium sp. MB40-C1 TaxID=3070996 RepID=UPI0027E03A20|nr:HD domain-containing protein [Clostridium sp. MB40-C1]WMJ79974.1 HD domain-containing protein [Clostridium sp. MB40-C1]
MDSIIEDVKTILKATNSSGYIVGGYIRDKLINPNMESKDIDIIIDGVIETFIKELHNKGYRIFNLNKDKQIYRATKNGETLDVAKLKGDTIEDDLKSRDFTTNAIALKLIDNIIIDPFRGRNHIKNRIIHPVTEDSIKNDRIRILRGQRLSIKYGMHFSESSLKNIAEESKYILNCPKERIFMEIMLILQEDNEGIAFEELDKNGVLKYIIPYIDELKTIGRCKYHIEDAFMHMNLVYKNFKELSKGRLHIEGLDLSIFDQKIGEQSIKGYMSLASFCHDIGKAKCYIKKEEKVSFIGHDKEGAKIISEVSKKIGLPKKGAKFVEKLVEAHMYPLGLCKNKIKNYKKSFYKFFSRYDEYIPYILALSYCDIHATKMLYDPDNEEKIFVGYLEHLLKEYKIFKECKEKRFLDGKEVVDITGAKGKDIKYILDELDRRTYYGEINNREEAINLIKSIKTGV